MTMHDELKHSQAMKAAAQIIDATQFWASVSVSGIDVNTGEIFDEEFIFTDKDPEFQAFINQWAARKIAEQLLKNHNG